MVRLGPYRQVFEAHRSYFLESGYSESEATGLAQTIVAEGVPDFALESGAAYLAAAIPHARTLLEYNQFEGVSLKVQSAVQMNASLFSDSNDPPYQQLIVSGVYPGEPGLVIVQALETGCWYAADWRLEDDECAIENVRDIGTYFETLSTAVTEGLLPAVELEYLAQTLPLQVERDYLTSVVAETEFYAPEVVLDGTRPVAEMEFVKFLRDQKVLTESFSAPFGLAETLIEPKLTKGEAIGRLAMVMRKLQKMESDYFNARLALENPFTEMPLSEKSTTIQSVIVSKDKFSKSEAQALGKRNKWGTAVDETGSSYRLRQFDPGKCTGGSFRTINLKEGVSAVICKLKSSKTERTNGNALRLTEAGDLQNMGGHHVFVDKDKAEDGDFEHVTRQINAHKRMRKVLGDEDFRSNGSGYQGEEHVKDAGNGYHVKVTLAAGKAHTTVHRNGGTMMHAVGTAKTANEMKDHIDDGMSAAASLPEVIGYES